MKQLPSKRELDIMWTVATSGALETGTRPHYGFADMLYDYLTDRTFNKYGVKLCDENLNDKIAAALQEAIKEYDS